MIVKWKRNVLSIKTKLELCKQLKKGGATALYFQKNLNLGSPPYH